MFLESLNYYGYSKETYKKCLSLICETDLRHAKILNVWFMLLSVAVFFFARGGYFTVLAGSPSVYFLYFIASVLWSLGIALDRNVGVVKTRLAVGSNILLLLSFSVYASVVQPYMSAAMFPVILVVVAFSYIDTFLTMFLVVIGGSAVFVWTSYHYKPLSIASVDIYNVVVFLTLALSLHYTFQRMRLSRFVTNYENINIQRDLEVRSSFDALTSLLNRGRFFTMASEIVRGTHEDYIALCLFDLDGFKEINDKLGHQMGDKAIQIAGEHLLKGFGIDFGEKWSFQDRANTEQLSFAGRLGGDEFIVFLRGRKNRDQVEEETAKLLEELSNVRAGELKGLYASVGIAELTAGDRDIDVAYTKADEALYQSKAAGKHRFTFSGEE